jgi:hypothetical protein
VERRKANAEEPLQETHPFVTDIPRSLTSVTNGLKD